MALKYPNPTTVARLNRPGGFTFNRVAPVCIQQEFNRETHGTAFKVVVTLGEVCGRVLLQIWLHWHNGYGGGSRRADSRVIGGETLLRVRCGCEGKLPRELLADVLQEEGYDDGITATVRGSDF